MPGPGRDQRGPIERLVRIVAALHAAGEDSIDGDRLIRIAGFDGEGAADQLSREIRQLKKSGWQIDNVAPTGSAARYRLNSNDPRLRLSLSPDELRALRRAALLARRADLAEHLGLPHDPAANEGADGSNGADVALSGHDDRLTTVLTAVRSRARVAFRYNGTSRDVHPYALQRRNNDWYLEGREVDVERVKKFLVSRMSYPEVIDPGSAETPRTVQHVGLHPMTWLVDEPVDVVVRCRTDFRDDVTRLLNEPDNETTVGDEVRLHYRVTHRAALRTRLLELGPRVTGVEGFDNHLAQLRAVVSGSGR
ncbi:WYL domain-containing protein [Nocardioidaceae bacterium]|nr:WYL domain-containing protein [Nocardioidaceae bacterium]